MTEFERIMAKIDRIQRAVEAAKRRQRIDAFVIGFLFMALVLSWLR